MATTVRAISTVTSFVTGTTVTSGITAAGASVIRIGGFTSAGAALNSVFRIVNGGTTTFYQVTSSTFVSGASPYVYDIGCIPPVPASIPNGTTVNMVHDGIYIITSTIVWETYTPTAGNIEIGELWGPGQILSTLNITGTAAPSATTYRMLRCGFGQQYDPRSGLGVYLENGGVLGAATSSFIIAENYFRMEGVAIKLTLTTEAAGTDRNGIHVTAGQFVDIHRCYVEVKGTSTSNALTGAGIKIDTGQNTCKVYNNIVVGKDISVFGTYHGINVIAAGCGIHNNTVWGFSTASASSHGITTSNGVGSNYVFNNYAFGSSGTDFALAAAGYTFKYTNCSEDSSVYDASLGLLYNMDANLLFVLPAYGDYRNKYSSQGLDAATIVTATNSPNCVFTDDYYGTVRSGLWDIGAFNGAVVPSYVDPTISVSSIGAGKTYASIAAWETATRLNCVYLNTVFVGEVYDNFDIGSTNIIIQGAITDATRYRALRPAAGLNFDPITATGIAIRGNGSGTNTGALTISEDYFRINNIRVEHYYSATSTSHSCFRVTRNNVRIDSCVALSTVGATAGYIAGFYISGGSGLICTNCVAIGAGVSVGMTNGFYEDTLSGSNLFANCIAYKILGYGFRLTSTSASFIKNCIGTDCTNAFYNTNMEPYLVSCISSDTTAVGLNSQISKSAASLFTDAASGNFTLKATGAAVNGGVSLQTIFTTDFIGVTRSAPWECGIYNGLFAGITAAKTERLSLMRFATCWKIERKDGFAIYATDHNCTILLQGQIYTPSGGFDSSVVRRELGMKADDTEFSGVIDAGAITHEDMRGGRYNLAKVTEYVVDWRYPWAQPQITATYYIKSVEFDGESWKATVAGISYLLQQPSGRLYSRQCDATLFDTRCKVLKASFTLSNKAVTSVASLSSFSCSTLGATTDLYKYGMLVWRSGANVGISCEVRSNTTTGIVLQTQVPYTIVNGDLFDISQGCAHTQDACITKYSNIVNYRGYREVPGTDRQLQTPIR